MSRPRRRRDQTLSAPDLAIPVPGNRPLTLEQMAHFLQVSKATVGRATRRGELPCVRVGNQLRFLPSDVIAVLQARAAQNKK
jgi:excisionase family DNA binding protein